MALITLTEFKNSQWDISASLKEKRFNAHAENAQYENVRPLLNDVRDDKFYWDIVDNPTQNTQKNNYEFLLEGGRYTYNGNDYQFIGLKDVIIDFTYERYVYWSGETDTAFGLVQKNYEDGIPQSEGRAVKRSKMAHASGIRKWESTKLFLNRMVGTDNEYEKWINSDYPINDQAGIKMNILTLR